MSTFQVRRIGRSFTSVAIDIPHGSLDVFCHASQGAFVLREFDERWEPGAQVRWAIDQRNVRAGFTRFNERYQRLREAWPVWQFPAPDAITPIPGVFSDYVLGRIAARRDPAVAATLAQPPAFRLVITNA